MTHCPPEKKRERSKKEDCHMHQRRSRFYAKRRCALLDTKKKERPRKKKII
jgi:hypothetical protein